MQKVLLFLAEFSICIAMLGVLAWLLGSVELGPPVPVDDESLRGKDGAS